MEELQHVAAALGKDGGVAGLLGRAPERHALFGVVDAHAVGAEDADAGGLGPRREGPFERRLLVVTGLAEAGGEELDGTRPLPPRLVDEVE